MVLIISILTLSFHLLFFWLYDWLYGFSTLFLIHLSISVFIFFPLLVVGSLDVVLCVWNTERANLADATCFLRPRRGPATAVYFNYDNTTLSKNFWSWHSWHHTNSLERCKRYCVYFCVLRYSGITMREIIASLSDDMTFSDDIVHAFVCRRFTSEWIKVLTRFPVVCLSPQPL